MILLLKSKTETEYKDEEGIMLIFVSVWTGWEICEYPACEKVLWKKLKTNICTTAAAFEFHATGKLLSSLQFWTLFSWNGAAEHGYVGQNSKVHSL